MPMGMFPAKEATASGAQRKTSKTLCLAEISTPVEEHQQPPLETTTHKTGVTGSTSAKHFLDTNVSKQSQ